MSATFYERDVVDTDINGRERPGSEHSAYTEFLASKESKTSPKSLPERAADLQARVAKMDVKKSA